MDMIIQDETRISKHIQIHPNNPIEFNTSVLKSAQILNMKEMDMILQDKTRISNHVQIMISVHPSSIHDI